MPRPFAIVLLAALVSCSRPSTQIDPAPDRVSLVIEPPQQGTGCGNGDLFLDLPAATRSWIVQADLTPCTGSQAAVVFCVQDAIDASIGAYCAAPGCCLDPLAWVARIDHGRSQVGADLFFEIEIHRRIDDERDTVWTVFPRNGFGSREQRHAAELAAVGTMPDVAACLVGGGPAEICARSSLGMSNYFATRVGGWDLAIWARGDARYTGGGLAR